MEKFVTKRALIIPKFN